MFAASAGTGSTVYSDTVVAGLPIPSTSPLFLTIVGVHVVLGIGCVIAGAVAMLSVKAPGRHPRFGTIYIWGLAGVFTTASALSAMRWAEDYYLFVLGALVFTSGWLGRTAKRRHWPAWLQLHIAGMGASYILLLTAFYVDNGKSLPLWRLLPSLTYWPGPAAVGIPIIAYALLHHPLVRRLRRTPEA